MMPVAPVMQKPLIAASVAILKHTEAQMGFLP